MHDQLIEKVVEELKPLLEGRAWGKAFQLSRSSLAVDFRTDDGRWLFISVEPNAPRLYMIARSIRQLEKNSQPPSPFALILRKTLSGASLSSLTKDEGDRIVRFSFNARDAAGRAAPFALVAQLTGLSSNLFLLDEEGRIVETFRPARGDGQKSGTIYMPPQRGERDVARAEEEDATAISSDGSLSEALDARFLQIEREKAFRSLASAHASRLRRETERREKLLENLKRDLERHGDADEHKRAGDLLLANVATAAREGARVLLTDYFAEDAPTIEIEIDESRTLPEEAAARFARYAKAKRAAEEIARRMEEVEKERDALEEKSAELSRIVAAEDYDSLEDFDEKSGASSKTRVAKSEGRRAAGKGKADETSACARRYLSSDGYEILVGRGARANEQLTFRVARSQDLWLHAADYPGSHVVVRKKTKGDDVPHRTLVEAAQMAALFSRAGKDAKVAVHYTERKYVSKIKGAAHGLVRLASFKTIMVEPKIDLERA